MWVWVGVWGVESVKSEKWRWEWWEEVMTEAWATWKCNGIPMKRMYLTGFPFVGSSVFSSSFFVPPSCSSPSIFCFGTSCVSNFCFFFFRFFFFLCCAPVGAVVNSTSGFTSSCFFSSNPEKYVRCVLHIWFYLRCSQSFVSFPSSFSSFPLLICEQLVPLYSFWSL